MNLPDKVFGIEGNLLVIYIWPVILVIIVLISINVVVTPRIEQMNSMKGESSKFAQKTKDLREKIAYLTQVDQAEMKSQAESLESALMNGKDSYYLVNIIRRISEKHGFVVESFMISPGTVSRNEVEPKLPIKVVIVGPKEGYLGLLLGIERNLPILSIDSFNVRSVGQVMELTLDMSSYYLSEKTVEKSANISLADLVMKQEETDVLKKLSAFTPIEDTPRAKIELGESDEKKTFVKYDRKDPFNP
ncbi:MAG: hypothetical protein WC841_02500 [Candidatus Shapirobacteria bacterium]